MTQVLRQERKLRLQRFDAGTQLRQFPIELVAPVELPGQCCELCAQRFDGIHSGSPPWNVLCV